MSIFSRIFGRRRDASLRARYDMAQTTEENAAHWSMATDWTADMEANPETRRTMRKRSRYEIGNNPWLHGAILQMSEDLIGTGPRLQVTGLDNQKAANEIERAFRRWSRRIGLDAILRSAFTAEVMDGESFIQMGTNPRLDTAEKLDLLVFDCDRVTAPENIADTDTDQQADGVFFDAFGRPLRYSVLSSHPGAGGLALSSRMVDARYIIHLFRRDRPEQHRGVPWLAAAFPSIILLRRYTLAMVKKMESSANISGVFESTEPDPSGDVNELEPWKKFDLPRDSFVATPRGWTFRQNNLQNPTESQQNFAMQVKLEAGRCLLAPRNVIMGDSSNYNYSSGRLDFQAYDKAIRVLRAGLESIALDRILAEWLGEHSPDMDVPEHIWYWDGRAHVDPTKEANAVLLGYQAGTLTRMDACAAEGKDWQVETEQLYKEAAFRKTMEGKYGVTLGDNNGRTDTDTDSDDREHRD
jgi:capsid protein